MYLNKITAVALLFMVACTSPKKVPVSPSNGIWQMKMHLEEGATLPFNFKLEKNKAQWEMTLFNANEAIVTNEIEQRHDSLFIQLPIFESEFRLAIINTYALEGVWVNYYKSDDYTIPVNASYNIDYRFQKTTLSDKIENEKYAVRFSPNTENEYTAIGLFSQNGNHLSGTFATETGDYRHLEGMITEDSMFLSTFDGSHAFLFQAAIEDSILGGTFWSGNHYQTNWTAVIDSSITLKDPDSLTFLKDDYDKISFSFPNEKGEMVSLTDERYKNKAVIIQIMGSWCPNCLDETNYLSSLYNKYHKDGLEIIALAFERTKTEEKAYENLKRLKIKTKAQYEFLLGGATRDDNAAEKLPMLNHIMSYPTAIFIDKQGTIERIHTGFYGPSTGEYYDEFVKETEELVQQMLGNS